MKSLISKWGNFGFFVRATLMTLVFTVTCCTVINRTQNPVPNGCKKELVIKDGQLAATEVIWRSFGGDFSRVAPIVEWYEGEKLDCPGGTSFWGVSGAGPYWQRRDCLLGVYIHSMHLVIVAYQPGRRMSDTALAHELCHAYFHEANPHDICKDDGSEDDPVTKAKYKLKMMDL